MAERAELIYFPNWTAGREGYAERVRGVFQDYLKTHELFLTPQRAAILNELLKADRHLTQDEIYSVVCSRGIGKATVFRTIKMLEEAHLVERVTDSQGEARFEVKMDRPHHDHLICLECNRITEIQWPDVERTQERVCKELGFEISFHRHELFGRCKECRAGRK